MQRPERVLAIDYGERRVGLALSDPDFKLVRGLPTIDRRSLRGALIDAVQEIVNRESIDRVVIGLPLTLAGDVGPQAEEVRRFADDLAAAIASPIEEWDERLTTEAARRALRDAGHDERAVRERVDQLAAVLMLESYLRARQIEAERDA